MTDHISTFLSTLTVDEAKATLHRLVALLPDMEAPEVTIVADPDDVDPDDPDYEGTPVWYCPTCDHYDISVVDIDASIRWSAMEPDRYEGGGYLAAVCDSDNENHTLYYLCENGNHVVTIDPTVDVNYG